MQKSLMWLGAAVLALFVLSCSGLPRVAVQPGFWKMTGKTVGLAFSPSKVPGAYRLGSQGLLDMAINEAATGSLEAHLRTLQLDGFDEIADIFQKNLESRGFIVRRIPDVVDEDSLERLPNSSLINYRPFAEKEGIDFLIIFSVRSWGTLREYYGFIPLQSPKAFCSASGTLVDLRTNGIAWAVTLVPSDARLDIPDPWDEPPDFPNVSLGVKKAVQRTKDFLISDFFENTLEKAQSTQ